MSSIGTSTINPAIYFFRLWWLRRESDSRILDETRERRELSENVAYKYEARVGVTKPTNCDELFPRLLTAQHKRRTHRMIANS